VKNSNGDVVIEAGSQWYNPVWGTCQYSIGTKLTFDQWHFVNPTDHTLPIRVIWTVQFNTTTAGYAPIGYDPITDTPSCGVGPSDPPSAPGCGYDSLNVGAKTYSAEAFAGTDFNKDGAFLSSTWVGTPPNSAYCDANQSTALRLDEGSTSDPDDCWFPNRPLGAIVTAGP
jgi:hypothetical protein